MIQPNTTVLFVIEDAARVKSVRSLLPALSQHLHCEVARSPTEALQTVQKRSFDLLAWDFGIETIYPSEIAISSNNAPVLGLLDDAAHENVVVLLKQGVAECLGWKQLNPETLERAVCFALARPQRRHTLPMRVKAELERKSLLVSLLKDVAIAANEAETAEEVLLFSIERVCKTMGWPLGHIYLTTEERPHRLIPTPLWWTEPGEEFEVFREESAKYEFPSGVGLPGRVAASRQPAWITDVNDAPDFERAKITSHLGVRAGFAFPVISSEKVWGVLEFFSREAREPDAALLEVMGHIGIQLGHVIARKNGELALIKSEARYRNLTSSATDAIITTDHTGIVTDWNEGAERIFGYKSEELLGQPVNRIIPHRYAEAHQKGMQRLTETGKTRVVGSTVSLEGLRSDGRELPIELSLSCLKTEDKPLYTAIIRDVTDHKRMTDELRHSEKQLKRLARRLQTVRENERTRLARDVHDILGQALTGITLDITQIEKKLSAHVENVHEHFSQVKENINEVVNIVRRISSDLRPGILDHLGLLAAIEWQTGEFGARANITCRFESPLDEVDLDAEHSIAIFRIFQELLTNVARHAQATEVDVRVFDNEEALVLVVQDNGCGIEDVEAVSNKSLGILGMRERISSWNGTLNLSSIPGEGTTATVVLPHGQTSER